MNPEQTRGLSGQGYLNTQANEQIIRAWLFDLVVISNSRRGAARSRKSERAASFDQTICVILCPDPRIPRLFHRRICAWTERFWWSRDDR